MPNPVSIQEFGNSLAIVYDNGSRQLAYPGPGGLWLISGEGEAPPDPPPAGGAFQWPFPLTLVTSEYGMRNGKLHAGIDFGKGAANNPATTIVAAGAGKAMIVNVHQNFGYRVVLDHGGGRYTSYSHMTAGSFMVSQGQTVTRGQGLGKIGKTGHSFGYHLHFETHEPRYTGNADARNPRLMIPKWNAQ